MEKAVKRAVVGKTVVATVIAHSGNGSSTIFFRNRIGFWLTNVEFG